MSTYQVIEVTPDGSLRPATRQLAAPAAGQARIRVEACGICHTDSFSVQPAQAFRVPGHEIVGVIDALGAGVEGWSAGQRVGVGFLGGHCGVCEFCRRGNFVACTNQPVTGMTVDGGYAEVAYARASGLVAIPDELTPPRPRRCCARDSRPSTRSSRRTPALATWWPSRASAASGT